MIVSAMQVAVLSGADRERAQTTKIQGLMVPIAKLCDVPHV